MNNAPARLSPRDIKPLASSIPLTPTSSSTQNNPKIATTGNKA